jgi:hypothetical protein
MRVISRLKPLPSYHDYTSRNNKNVKYLQKPKPREMGARSPKEGCMFEIHDVKTRSVDVRQGCHTSCQPYTRRIELNNVQVMDSRIRRTCQWKT